MLSLPSFAWSLLDELWQVFGDESWMRLDEVIQEVMGRPAGVVGVVSPGTSLPTQCFSHRRLLWP